MADYGLARNGSGYYDETAYKAFMGMAKAGDIWTANDGREEVLILRNQGTFCNCLTLTNKSMDKQCIEVVSAGTMYTNPGMVKYLFNSRLGAFVQRLPASEFEKVREAVEDAMGFRKPEVKIDKQAIAHELLDMILDRVGEL